MLSFMSCYIACLAHISIRRANLECCRRRFEDTALTWSEFRRTHFTGQHPPTAQRCRSSKQHSGPRTTYYSSEGWESHGDNVSSLWDGAGDTWKRRGHNLVFDRSTELIPELSEPECLEAPPYRQGYVVSPRPSIHRSTAARLQAPMHS